MEVDAQGAVMRGDRRFKQLSLVFTGDEFGESADVILDELKSRGLRASFFVTGNFARNPKLRPLVDRMVAEGHYVGPHSDRHLLYCPWEDRDKSLVTEAEFKADLTSNLAALRELGAPPEGTPTLFIPPYEWHNRQHVKWARKLGVYVINFTPGTGSNRDYAREGDRRFVPSQRILDDILAYEQRNPAGLNGVLLLLHLGSGREDPFHSRFGLLCDELARHGYSIVRTDALLTALTSSSGLKYPTEWWAEAPSEGSPEWEILPQAAGPGEVILSKRNKLGILSNFAPTPFVFRGKHFASIEGFWQAMKYPEGSDDPRLNFEGNEWKFTREQVEQMTAFEAKEAGRLGSMNMARMGIDWVSFEGRHFPYRPATPGEHYHLIVGATREKVRQNSEVARILRATGDLVLKPDHKQEPNPPAAWRYCEILMEIREELAQGDDENPNR